MTVSAIGPEVCETADIVEYLKMPSRGRRGRGRGLQVTPKKEYRYGRLRIYLELGSLYLIFLNIEYSSES
jgi:hypothetical protein